MTTLENLKYTYHSELATTRQEVNPVLLYCNGIEATPEQAEEQAQIISRAFQGKKVFVSHNSTKLNDYTRPTGQAKEKQETLIQDLVSKIRNAMIKHPWNSDRTPNAIALFAHSHGAYLTHNALRRLGEDERHYIDVFAFGGVSMIPKKLASTARNYVYLEDRIALSGSALYDPDDVLGKVVTIEKRMRADNLSLASALSQQCVEETYHILDSTVSASDPDKVSREDKSRRFGQGFLGGDETAFDREAVKEKLGSYKRCFDEYNIEVLSRPFPRNSSSSLDLDALAQETIKEMTTYGTHGLNCHCLSAFTNNIETIAKEILAAYAKK